ncbi:hypothetical protein [Streptomyces sp. NPDC052114]|uniref:effector-associated constant component EACC1 n=1 Tax=unclassified Streptomyces TaxID=2593676 RepID=UPI0034280D59
MWDWLRQEPAPRGRVRRDMPPPQAGTMGVLSELVVESAVTGTIGALTGARGGGTTATGSHGTRMRGGAIRHGRFSEIRS